MKLHKDTSYCNRLIRYSQNPGEAEGHRVQKANLMRAARKREKEKTEVHVNPTSPVEENVIPFHPKFSGEDKRRKEEVANRIARLYRKGEDQKGTPEGNAFLAKAQALAEAEGINIEDALVSEAGEMTVVEQNRLVRKLVDKMIGAAKTGDLWLAVYKAAVLYMVDHYEPDIEIETFLHQINEKF